MATLRSETSHHATASPWSFESKKLGFTVQALTLFGLCSLLGVTLLMLPVFIGLTLGPSVLVALAVLSLLGNLFFLLSRSDN